MQDEGSPKGLFLNVTASINRLFSLHGDRGLFAQNLRQFIRNKKVDDAISDTISNEPDSFWLKNNGLTVACSDCRFDGKRLVLYEFSIINGCQTATKIGKSVLPNGSDFLVPCKVIRETNKATMAAFAEAANSQKPIQDRDLKANAPEQTRLKMRFLNSSPPIYVSIKRGVKQFTRAQRVSRNIRDWQQLDNKLYGQLVLAFHCQKPHISFAQAGKIFGSRETYKEVFLRSQDLATEKDLLRLHDAFLSWRESKFQESVSSLQEAILTHGRFALLASCALLAKMKRDLIDTALCQDRDIWQRELVRRPLAGPLLLSDNTTDLPDITTSNLHDLFGLLLEVHESTVEDTDIVARLYKSDDFYAGAVTPRLISRSSNHSFARYLADAMAAFLRPSG